MTDLSQTLGRIAQSLEDLKEDVGEIKRQTTRTNGRVTDLEIINEVRQAKEAQRQRYLRWLIWALGVVVTVFSGTLGAIILGVH